MRETKVVLVFGLSRSGGLGGDSGNGAKDGQEGLKWLAWWERGSDEETYH